MKNEYSLKRKKERNKVTNKQTRDFKQREKERK